MSNEKKEYFGAITITLRCLMEADSESDAKSMMYDCLNEIIGTEWFDGSLIVSDWDSSIETKPYELQQIKQNK